MASSHVPKTGPASASRAPQRQEGGRPLFYNVVFHVVRNDSLSEDEYIATKTLLLKGGACEYTFGSASHELDLTKITHIIANSVDFPAYQSAEDSMVSVVRPQWVWKSSKLAKIAPLRPFSPNERHVLAEINITVEGLAQGDKAAVQCAVRALGGQWSDNLTKFTTHLVVQGQDSDKYRQAQRRSTIKIVLPQWVEECLRLKRRVDEGRYLFPCPAFLEAAADTRTDRDHSSGSCIPSLSSKRAGIFAGKWIYLSADLSLSGRLLDSVRDLINRGGGEYTDNVDDADTYVGVYRRGSEYAKACKRGIVVGNLAWLYWMVANDQWVSPLLRILHYPVPSGGVHGMKDMSISISNYTGDSRHYLEKLIEACGAKYTKVLKNDNTHLIASRPTGDKYEAACDWRIHVVNHLWIEETYAAGAVQDVQDARYTCTQAGVAEVIGKVQLDKTVVEQAAVEAGPEPAADVEMEEAAVPRPDEPAPEASAGETGADAGIDRPAEPGATATAPAEAAKRPAESTLRSEPPRKEPSKKKAAADRKENRRSPAADASVPPKPADASGGVLQALPVTPNQGRKAKEKAAVRLKDDMSDLNDFQRQKRRKTLTALDGNAHQADTPASKAATPQASSSPNVSPEPANYRILVTGYSRTLTQADQHKLLSRGIEITENSLDATHVASPKISRTEKFLCALPRGPVVISSDFITDSLKADRPLDPLGYILKDTEGEHKNGCDLLASLERARQSGGQGPFAGLNLNMTPGIRGGTDTIRRIVQANGGQCTAIKAARAKKFSESTLPSTESVLILISSESEHSYIENFMAHAKRHNKKAFLFSTEWILTGVLRMGVKYDSEFSLASGA
ncbi:uncharacterized protein V1510DRAFT_391265 [Dipodascopsis tothii]|uniref:uncharacterized protein n=1 Tax=Dipodascopsis tothii TaxID=44089 RepID=UPI0034CDAF64